MACGLCSRVCPALAICVQASDTKASKERQPENFEIDMLRCIFCGLCEEVCPEEAIVMSKDYELVFQSQSNAKLDKDKLANSTADLRHRFEFLDK